MVAVMVTTTIVLVAAVPNAASASVESEELVQFGVGEPQFSGLVSIGISPSAPGHLYVTNGNSNRIDEFGPWGQFVGAFGWGVSDGKDELERCSSACLQGIPGSGAGQMSSLLGAAGLTVDPIGDVYVYERLNLRVQKFSPSGEFLLMFGGDVDKTTGADVCTKADVEAGDVCGTGLSGTGPGEFSAETDGDYLATDPAGRIVVGDSGRIQIFDTSGAFQGALPLPHPGSPGALAIDESTGDIYFSYANGPGEPSPDIDKLDGTTGALLGTLEVAWPKGVAVEPDGRVLAIEETNPAESGHSTEPLVLEFGPDGSLLSSCCAAPVIPGNENNVHLKISGIAANTLGDLYVASNADGLESSISGYGPPPTALEPPPLVPPTIESQFASTVGTATATLRASIDPHFWEDTTYYVEYGIGRCVEGGCAEKEPLPPGPRLTGKVTGNPVASAGILLEGLTPSTTYHYRFVSQSTGSGGEYVRGVGGTVGHEGTESTFTTFPTPSGTGPCPNEAARGGPAQGLPDCRAYEMVSPVDKEGGDVGGGFTLLGFPTTLTQSSQTGEAFTYSAYRAFGVPEAAPFTSQYLARRDPQGLWSSKAISASRGGPSIYDIERALENEYKSFSPELTQGWLAHDSDPPLASGAHAGYTNLYRRDLDTGSFEALSTGLEPTEILHPHFVVEFQGASANGQVAVFRANSRLTPDAAHLGERLYQVYQATTSGGLALVSVLPNGSAAATTSSAGTANGQAIDRLQSIQHAVSADGSILYWSAAATNGANGEGRGPLYARLDGATTVVVSANPDTQFEGAARNGQTVIFSFEGNLFSYDLASGKRTLLASEALASPLGMSEDAKRVYFISKADLVAGASTGSPNLYLADDGVTRFVARLTVADANPSTNLYSAAATLPVLHTARSTPDGEVLVFTSTADLTGYDNTDQKSGKSDAEVYRYDIADGGRVACVSCNPSDARPAGREVKMPADGGSLPVAATVPPFENQNYDPRYISTNGSRVYFDSYDALVNGDVNSREDVYEWEAKGEGDCTVARSSYVAASEGCLSLISSGESPEDSEFLDASPDGRDIFFATGQSLVPQDPGSVDVYDARVDGGALPPNGPVSACDRESCQPQIAPPAEPFPSTSTFHGKRDVSKCVKGRRMVQGKKHKPTCTKKKKHKHKKKEKKAKRPRRTGR
jgi:hypothetical protein